MNSGCDERVHPCSPRVQHLSPLQTLLTPGSPSVSPCSLWKPCITFTAHLFYMTQSSKSTEEISDIFIESLPASFLFFFYCRRLSSIEILDFYKHFSLLYNIKPRIWIENSHQDQSWCIQFNLIEFVRMCFTKSHHRHATAAVWQTVNMQSFSVFHGINRFFLIII